MKTYVFIINLNQSYKLKKSQCVKNVEESKSAIFAKLEEVQ